MGFRIKHAAKRDGYAFALANGLPATMYRLDNARIRDLALTCTRVSSPHSHMGVAPADWKKYYAFIIEVDGEKVGIVSLSRVKVSRLVGEITDAPNAWRIDPTAADFMFEDEMLFGLYLIACQNTAYYSSHPDASKLKQAIASKIRPSVCTVIY